MQGDPTTCGFIRDELENEALEAQECRLQIGKDVVGDGYAKLNEELQEVKQILDTFVAKLWKPKVQPAEPTEVDTRKL